MYRYLSISLFAVLFFLSLPFAAAQSESSSSQQTEAEDEESRPKEPRFEVVKDQGLSLGIDLSPFIMRAIKDERTGFAFIVSRSLQNAGKTMLFPYEKPFAD